MKQPDKSISDTKRPSTVNASERAACDSFAENLETAVQDYIGNPDACDGVQRAGRAIRALKAMLKQVREYEKRQIALN